MSPSSPEHPVAAAGLTAEVRKRRRAPELHRAAILDAAREAFAERGFARTTIRDVARRAGVTHGLVIRHFASKEQLFLAAIPGTRDLGEYVVGDLKGLPERVARAYVERMESAGGSDPFVALIRSAASDEEAAKRLLTGMRERSVIAYQTVLPEADLENRVELLGALLIGVTFERYVLGSGPLSRMTPGTLVDHLTVALDAILFDPVETAS